MKLHEFQLKTSGSSSRFIGVCKLRRYWGASITKDYKMEGLGTFKTEEDAARAYNKRALELYDGPLLNEVPPVPEAPPQVTEGSNKRKRIDASSRFVGVIRHGDTRWSARLHIGGTTIHLGMFTTEEGAAVAYNEGVSERGLDYRLNEVSPELAEASSSSRQASRFTGIARKRGGWASQIYFNGKRVSLGSFDDEVKAAAAYNAAVIKYGLKDRRLNKIPEPSVSALSNDS
jgi:hypothetical protein